MRRLWICLCLLVSCGQDIPGAPPERAGALEGDRPSVLLLIVEQAQASDLDRQGLLDGNTLVSLGTRMGGAYGRFDQAAATRTDLLGSVNLPGLDAGGDLAAHFVAGDYRTPELSVEDYSALWTGSGPAFGVLNFGGDQGLGQATAMVESLLASEHGAEVLWAVVALTGDPAAEPISEGRLAVPMVLGIEGRLERGEIRPQVVSHADLAATLLDLCDLGRSPGEGAEGQSFARLLIKKPHAWRGHVLARCVAPSPDEPWGWVRSRKWRMVIGPDEFFELSYVEADPLSQQDDSGRPGASTAAIEMRRVLDAWN
ncbi:MAG: hypothetical protein ACI8QC_002776 [Planctomycetota bacterium]|jgi:hypothetical protein